MDERTTSDTLTHIPDRAAIGEAAQRMEAGSTVLASALGGGPFTIVEAAEHAIVMNEQAARWLAIALVLGADSRAA